MEMTSFGLSSMLNSCFPLARSSRLDGDYRLFAVRGLPVDEDLVHGLGGQASGLGDDLEQGRRSDELILPGLADGADDRDFLVFLDEHRDVSALGILLIQESGQLLFELLSRQPGDLDLAEEGQRDRAIFRDADRLVELGQLENGDFQEVLGPDPVVVDRQGWGVLGGKRPQKSEGHENQQECGYTEEFHPRACPSFPHYHRIIYVFSRRIQLLDRAPIGKGLARGPRSSPTGRHKRGSIRRNCGSCPVRRRREISCSASPER